MSLVPLELATVGVVHSFFCVKHSVAEVIGGVHVSTAVHVSKHNVVATVGVVHVSVAVQVCVRKREVADDFRLCLDVVVGWWVLVFCGCLRRKNMSWFCPVTRRAAPCCRRRTEERDQVGGTLGFGKLEFVF
ncbi:Hypothetical predicted protein [Olea europaea subsp. europaea]|uniref:Uncharacterized protein n=1 Tax=Olea europaea subsp. europaea TaxID=158383 RepID=A0A8S0PDW8_OLEEU|nr:Hypothetical predicted protein [Olea europaea subsp. europaea]